MYFTLKYILQQISQYIKCVISGHDFTTIHNGGVCVCIVCMLCVFVHLHLSHLYCTCVHDSSHALQWLHINKSKEAKLSVIIWAGNGNAWHTVHIAWFTFAVHSTAKGDKSGLNVTSKSWIKNPYKLNYESIWVCVRQSGANRVDFLLTYGLERMKHFSFVYFSVLPYDSEGGCSHFVLQALISQTTKDATC
jgi:hypothetical protein